MRRVADRVEDGLGAFAARSLFQYWAVNGRAMPDTSIATPVTRAIARPYGVTFSSSTNTLIAATHSRFITPRTKSSAISIQQHPTQNAPCLRAIWPAVAAVLNSVHTTTYAPAKSHTLYAEAPLRVRAMRA